METARRRPDSPNPSTPSPTLLTPCGSVVPDRRGPSLWTFPTHSTSAVPDPHPLLGDQEGPGPTFSNSPLSDPDCPRGSVETGKADPVRRVVVHCFPFTPVRRVFHTNHDGLDLGLSTYLRGAGLSGLKVHKPKVPRRP